MIGLEKTDLDIVHNIILNEQWIGRRYGKTFAFCHTLAGVVELCDEKVVVVLMPNYGWLHHIKRIVHRVFTEMELDFEWTRNDEMKVEGKALRFASVQRDGERFQVSWVKVLYAQ